MVQHLAADPVQPATRPMERVVDEQHQDREAEQDGQHTEPEQGHPPQRALDVEHADQGRQREQRQRQHGRAADDAHGGDAAGDAAAAHATLGEHRELQGAAGGGAPRHDLAEGGSRELGRGDEVPAVHVHHQTVLPPHAHGAGGDGGDHPGEPRRLDAPQLGPAREHVPQAGPDDVQPDGAEAEKTRRRIRPDESRRRPATGRPAASARLRPVPPTRRSRRSAPGSGCWLPTVAPTASAPRPQRARSRWPH